jgi:hypothetical protein
MHCTRCDGITPDVNAVTLTMAGHRDVVWSLCARCQLGLQTWYIVRKSEFPAHATDAKEGVNAELLHACRQALDVSAGFPQLLDVLRTAIRGALK